MKPRGERATPLPPKDSPDRDDPQATAIAALSFLAMDGERLGRFLALSGLTPRTLRAAAAEPGFLAAVIDHIAADEALLLSFAASTGRDPSDVARARSLLGGPEPEPSP